MVIRVHGFGNSITKQDERVSVLEFRASGDVLRFGEEADGIAAFDKGLSHLAMAKKEWRRVAGINEIEMAVFVQGPEKHGGIAPDLRMFAEKAIDEVEDTRRIVANGHPEKGALEHGSKKRGAEPLTGNI